MKKRIPKTLVFLVLLAATVAVALLLASCDAGGKDSPATHADSVVRVHIRANSNTAEDQGVKLEVRDALTSYLTEVLNGGLPEGYTDILYGVMEIDFDIPSAFDIERKAAVTGKEFEHMIQKPAAGINFVISAVKVKGQFYIRFACFTANFASSHIFFSVIFLTSERRIATSSGVPTVILT